MTTTPDRLIWIDLEMTGLDSGEDSIIEIATIVTSSGLETIAEGPVLAIYQPEEVLDRAEKSAVLGRVAEPEDVSRVVAFLASEEARHITGQVIVVDGGLTIGW